MNEHALNIGFTALIICALLITVGGSTRYTAKTAETNENICLSVLGLAFSVFGAFIGLWGIATIIGSFS